MTDNKTPRRRSLLKGAALAAGAMSAPMVATAQTTTTLRFQSTWPAKDIFHEYANDFANKVNLMASGKLKIEVLPSGSVVPAFQLLEASYQCQERAGSFERPLVSLLFDDTWDEFRDDPRFQSLLEKIGFTKVMPHRNKVPWAGKPR